jgi:hypothetical protein
VVHILSFWWIGSAMAEEVFETYQTTFNCNIYETDFYHLEQKGIAIQEEQLHSISVEK